MLYQQFFYRVDFGNQEADVGALRRAQIVKATLALGKVDGVLMATSCGGRYASEPCEVSLVMPADEDADSMLAHVLKFLADQAPEAAVTLREGLVRYHMFNDEQLENIERATKIGSMEAAYLAVDACCASPSEPVNVLPLRSASGALALHLTSIIDAHDVHLPAISPQHRSEPFTVTRAEYLRLRGARENHIEDEYHTLLAAFEALSSEDILSAAIVTMVANGLLTIGHGMREAYTTLPWGGSLAFWLGELISAAGGMSAVIPAAASICAHMTTLFVALKE